MMDQDFRMDVPALRRVPANPEAEAALLSGFMLDPEAWGSVSDLDVAAFYVPLHRTVFSAVQALAVAGHPTDPVSVFSELQQRDARVALKDVHDLTQYVPARAGMRRYAEAVQDAHRLRQLIDAGTAMADSAMDSGASAGQEIDKAQMALAKLASTRTKREPQGMSAALAEYLQHLQDLSDGLNPAMATGISEFDRLLNGGLRRGELLVLGARPKHGKTALALAIARNMAVRHGVLFLSQEMPVKQLMHRHAAAASSIDMSRILAADPDDRDMWAAVTGAAQHLGTLRLHHDDQTSLTLGDIRRKAIKVKRESGLDVLFVDFLQRMAGAGDENRSRDLDLIINGIKDLAMDLEMSAVVLSQMNREPDTQYCRPRMNHLRESGAIEAAADQIALLFTDWAHPMSKHLPEFREFSELEIVAHRNGPQGVVPLLFAKQYQQMSDWYGPVPQRSAGTAFGSKGRSNGGFSDD